MIRTLTGNKISYCQQIKLKKKPYRSVTPGKGQYGLFESLDSDFDVKTLVVPVPTKNFAGVYAFKSGNLEKRYKLLMITNFGDSKSWT